MDPDQLASTVFTTGNIWVQHHHDNGEELRVILGVYIISIHFCQAI